MMRLSVPLCLSMVVGCVSVGSAQTDGGVAVGVDASVRAARAGGTRGDTNVGFLYRLGHGRNGWGWQYGLSWFSADLQQPVSVQQPVGNGASEFGELRVRPFMGGYGYSRRFGPALINANVLAGYAVNSFKLQPTFDDAYRQTLGAATVTADVSNGFVVRPELSAWVDLSRKVGLKLSAGYMIARPHVTVSSTLGRDTRHINADVLMLRVGAVYSIF